MHDGHDGGHDGGHGGGMVGAIADAGAPGEGFDLGHLASSLGSDPKRSGAGLDEDILGSNRNSWAFGCVRNALTCMGLCPDDLAQPEAPTEAVPGPGIGVRLPGILYRLNTIQMLVWPHGEVSTQDLFAHVARRHGLQSLSRRARGIVASSKEHLADPRTGFTGLLDTKEFDGPGKTSRPSASYPGATGITTVWREAWQLPTRKHWWSAPELSLEHPLASHVVATGYTWFYDQTGDYESRIAISVTLPKTCVAGNWQAADEDGVKRHRLAINRIADDLFAELKKVKPKEYSVILREMQAGTGIETDFGPTEEVAPAPGSPRKLLKPIILRPDPVVSFDMVRVS